MAAWSFWGIFGMFLKSACRKWNLPDTRMSAPFAKKIASHGSFDIYYQNMSIGKKHYH